MKKSMIIAAILFTTMLLNNVHADLFSYCSTAGTVNALAPWYCSQINQSVVKSWNNWAPIAVVAILFSFTIATLIFLVGVIFNSDRVRTYGIGEFYEAIATTLIVTFFLYISSTMFGILPSIVTGPINPYNTSLSYISQTINSTDNVLSNLFYIENDAYYVSTLKLDIFIYFPNQHEWHIPKPLQYPLLFLFVNPAVTIAILLIDGLMVLYIEYYLILFLMYAAIPVFLIPGIIFRALLPTRSMGGMMVAVAIGFYLIMPMLFSISFYFTSQSSITSLNNAAVNLNKFSDCSQNPTTGSLVCNFPPGTVSPSSPLVTQIADVKTAMSSFWISVLFFPALNLAITYFSILTIANLIGGMAQTSRRLTANI